MNRKELVDYITETYSVDAEYPFLQYPDFAVFRHANNRKWFAVIMDIPKSKLGLKNDGMIAVVNLKCAPILVGSLRNENGFFPAYHMSKTNWISVALDGSVENEKIKWLLDMSFDLTAKKIKSREK
ncbi:MAG: MmcQ/YjbR family DNA-binding protein [Clostridia bacterium]|nr:MmcQ/YjbR family DNA-binding protein [Clostridia bacterium]